MRRRLLIIIVGLASLGFGTSPAHAAKLVTWSTTSAHVDPAKEPMGDPPDGVARPPALRVNVYEPSAYDGTSCRPVLYLMHGAFGAYDYWSSPAKLDVLNLLKDFPGFIVMPDSGAIGAGIDYWNGGKRDDPGWASYHLDDLIPLVERRLNVCPGRRNHAIGGYSAGGLTAALDAAARPGYFGSLASFSGVLSPQRPEFVAGFGAALNGLFPDYFGTQISYEKLLGDPVLQKFYWDGHDPTALIDNLRHTRVFLSNGDGIPRNVPSDVNHPVKPIEAEVKLMAQDFMHAADRAGVRYRHVENPGVHDYPYFKVAVRQANDWGFFRSVPESPKRWTYSTTARSGQMWNLDFRFKSPPQVLERFRRTRDTLSASGAGTVTITSPEGCSFTAALPFTRALPRCWHGRRPA